MAKKRLTREELENLLNEKEKEINRLNKELSKATDTQYLIKLKEYAEGYQLAIREVFELLKTMFKKEY